MSLKEYQPALEGIFMESFHFVMKGGGAIALLGTVISFLRGPERINKRNKQDIKTAGRFAG